MCWVLSKSDLIYLLSENVKVLVAQSRSTLCDPMDDSPGLNEKVAHFTGEETGTGVSFLQLLRWVRLFATLLAVACQTVHKISQARILLQWVAISSSRGSGWGSSPTQ